MRRAHQTFCEAPADGGKFYLQVTGKRFFAKGVAYNPRNEPLGITKRTSGLGFSALPLDHCSRPGTISTTLGQAFNSLVGWTSASLENQREVPPVDLAETTWGKCPIFARFLSVTWVTWEVTVDTVQMYKPMLWKSTGQLTWKRDLAKLCQLFLVLVLILLSFLPQDSCIVSLV